MKKVKRGEERRWEEEEWRRDRRRWEEGRGECMKTPL